MIGVSLSSIQTSIASVTQTARRQSPFPTALAGCGAVGCERLGERASRSRIGWVAMFAVPALLLFVDPAAAQVSCDEGMLKFLSDIQTLTVESVGILLFVILLGAGALKAAPMKGTDSWGNSLLGGFLVGVAFFVLGPGLIDLANSATPVDMSAGCSTGGN